MPVLLVLLTKHTLYVTQSQDPVFWENFSLNLSERIILLHFFFMLAPEYLIENLGVKGKQERGEGETGDVKRLMGKK